MTSDIAIWEGGQVDGYRPQIMTPEAARELDEQIRLCVRAVMREGIDYGTIPGTGEKSLWRPGAQRLLRWFQLEFTCERVELERDDQGRKHGITYRAEVGRGLKTATPVILATCEGTADYDESKFYQSAEEVQRKAEYNERKWAKQYNRVADPTKWKDRGEWRADWNALMKRAQKRALVGATSDATAAGGVFTDREDDDPPVPQNDGPQGDEPTWYEQALEQALTFTTQEKGRALYAEAAHAGRDGKATRRQVDHVQNRVRQRAERLKARVQVDVEDLADSAAAAAADADAEASQDVPPADTRTPQGAAPAAPAPAGGTSERLPAKLTSGQKEQLKAAYEGLGYDQDEEGWEQWLRDLAQLAGLEAIAAPTELNQAEAKRALDQLKGLDAAGLRRLLDNGEVPDGQ